MFSWITSRAWEETQEWLYGKLIEFLGTFFDNMNNMGAELFELPWMQAIVFFFSYFGWALFVTGLVVAVFDVAVEWQSGRADIKGTALNVLKAFFAVNLFTVIPVRLYSFCISLQSGLTQELAGLFTDTQVDMTTLGSIGQMSKLALLGDAMTSFNIFNFFLAIALGYCVIKVFFANIKRGGILLIQIAVGSLYMFSVPRGYGDGFTGWSKQIIALCLTAFLQTTVLIAGLLTWNTSYLLGIGLMLAASEVERIAGNFGLDTSVKGNFMSAVYATSSVVNIVKTIAK
ncbi:MAG: DUF6045 family protein [Oscillospiraceae bacterium]